MKSKLKMHEDSTVRTNSDAFGDVKHVQTVFWSEGCSQLCADVVETRFHAELFIFARLSWNK